jgi:hypothetical protein
MLRSRTLLFILFLSLDGTGIVCGQEQPGVANPKIQELRRMYGRPLVEGEVNGVHGVLLVDTGATLCGVPIGSEHKLGLPPIYESTEVMTLKGRVKTRKYGNVQLRADLLEPASVSVIEGQLAGESPWVLPEQTIGLIGLNYMDRMALQISVANSEVQFIDSPAVRPHDHSTSARVQRKREHGVCLISVEFPVIGRRELAVDTGCLVGSVHPDVLLRKEMLEFLCRCGAALPLFRDDSPASSDQYVIRSIRFAGLTFTNVIASASSLDVISLELLKDVDLTLDFPEGTAWFTPVSPQPDDYVEGTFDASGLFVHFVEHNRLAVHIILPDSPADAAGVREGDVITAINHRPAGEWSLVQIHRLLSSPGTTVVLDIVRNHDHMTINVPLKHDQTLFNFPPEWPPEQPEFNPCGPVDVRQN